jgi:hypothetical protein
MLDYLAARASRCRILRAAGAESEMELAFAGVHQLCMPMLTRLAHLPSPQVDAVSTAFGLSTGEAPDRFLVGLAVLGLLSEAAEDQPLVCLVDDAQWLDRESAQTLAFVARRLLAESVALVFAMREPAKSKSWLGFRNWRWRVSMTAMLARSWTWRYRAAWMNVCGTGSSLRRAVTLSRCWSCPGD